MRGFQIYFSLDLMRRYMAHVCLLIFATAIFTRADVIADYEARTGKIATDAIEAVLVKEPARWKKIHVKYRFNITDDGRVRDLTITSAPRNAWIESAARRALLSLRMPPVPTEILKRVGHNGLYSIGGLMLKKK
jgi:hypothetical protein